MEDKTNAKNTPHQPSIALPGDRCKLMSEEERRLRRLCGEGQPGVWIPPDVSIEALRAFAEVVDQLCGESQGRTVLRYEQDADRRETDE
jgi:hypothetical protein